jgi:hypothetical protein
MNPTPHQTVLQPGFIAFHSNRAEDLAEVVIKRGLKTTMPKVAVLINRQGMVTGEPILRDTSTSDFRIVASVPYREVKVNHNLERLLLLVRPGPVERPW